MRDGRPVVLVTGASGFVGRHLAPAMARAGWLVRRAVRKRPARKTRLSSAPSASEEHAVELYRSVNIVGMLEFARSAAAAGVGQFIFVSTVLVHGRSNDGRAPFRESDVLTPAASMGCRRPPPKPA
jgi:UDP-glucose 4-epimerase